MIKKLKPEDIINLQDFDDHIEDLFPCSKAEWNQWLMANISNPNVLIIGDKRHYLVAMNTVHKPINDHIFIIFFYSEGDFTLIKEIRKMVDDWAREKGTNKIRFLCQDMRPFKKYGAEQKGILAGWEI